MHPPDMACECVQRFGRNWMVSADSKLGTAGVLPPLQRTDPTESLLGGPAQKNEEKTDLF